ncbi:MAG: S8 family serine peptidase [Cytophagales bacterium]|nr:S8 family serine peptidase [Cytophagales bacterium]
MKKPSKKTDKNETVPQRIFAQASPRSIGGRSLFDVGTGTQNLSSINSQNVVNFFSEENTIRNAVTQLQNAGFEILQVTPTTINIAGDQQTYEKAFNTKIIAQERPAIKSFGELTTATFLDSPDTNLPGLISTANSSFANILEGVAIEVPRYFMGPSMYPPLKPYWHLRLPGDVSLACNADKVHRGGITGKGIKVAMCDSGWFQHPYFVGRGYRAAPVVLGPGAANPLRDESGHGTGESANIFALAPDVDFLPVKMSFVNSIGAFNAAVGLGPNIITCSWGSDIEFGPLSAADLALAAAIAAAVASGIIVVFSAGNGHWGFPGQHPDVISAGGVFMDADESLRASDYASGFMSNVYPGRRVPDLCGLVGMRPSAAYLMLPVEPNDEIDTEMAGGAHPDTDETAANDGWAAFSGTSAAAPQLAGAAALVKQACPGLTPFQVRDILKRSARDVTAGNASPRTGNPAAGVGPDTATGNGLVDAHKAVLFARIRCMPIGPITPIVSPILPPIQPVNPVSPVVPIAPIGPINPIIPVVPIVPIRPIEPINPGPQVMQAPATGTAQHVPPAIPPRYEQDLKRKEDHANK